MYVNLSVPASDADLRDSVTATAVAAAVAAAQTIAVVDWATCDLNFSAISNIDIIVVDAVPFASQ